MDGSIWAVAGSRAWTVTPRDGAWRDLVIMGFPRGVAGSWVEEEVGGGGWVVETMAPATAAALLRS